MKTKIAAMFFAVVGAAIASSLDQGAYNVSVSAKALIAAYEENEVRADVLYAGKFISVGGKAGQVKKEPDGDPFLELFPSDEQDNFGLGLRGPRLHCRFSEAYVARISTIRPGSLIGVKGLVVGRRNGEIMLKNCRL